MTDIPNSEEVVRPLSISGAQQHWIASAPFDLIFLILAPLVTAPIVAGVKFGFVPLACLGFVLAVPHYLSTVSFLMWKENANYQRSHRSAYLFGPMVLASVYGLLVVNGVPYLVQVLLFGWTIFHVARQNCGLLGIYRHRIGVTDPTHKHAANTAIISTSVWMSLWYIDSHKELKPLFYRIDPRMGQWLWITAGAIAMVACIRLSLSLVDRARQGTLTSFPELAFLVLSLIMFAPYFLIRDINVATFVMLLPHYVQYLGIVWLINRRRAMARKGGVLLNNDSMTFLSRSLPLLIATLLAIGIAGSAGVLWSSAHQNTIFTALFTLVALEHYYLDGLVWAFKSPHVRRTMGPWIQPAEAELFL